MSQSINLYKQLANHKLFNKTINFDLKRINLVLKKLKHPEKKLNNVINFLGSSGKFSTLFSLKSFIEANNQTATAYISPSLRDIKERFWIGDRYLTHQEIKKSIKIIEKLKVPLTIFEVLTVIYIMNASKQSVNYNLVEAGALFAKDSTNVFNFPLAQIIVNINKQHLNFLKKKTLDEVIHQKVGFLSNFTKIYVGKQKLNVLSKIRKNLKKNKSKIIYPNSWSLIKKSNQFYYKDKKTTIKISAKNIYSKGLLENLCHAIKIALDLKISKKIIEKTIPKVSFEGRFQYLNKGKIKKKLYKNEKVMLDGAHAETDAKNLASYLKTINLPKYGIWAMMKNKEPDLFIKKLKNTFKKIITIPIENEQATMSSKELYLIALKNKLNVDTANNFGEALKKISSKEKKLIVCFGSLYNIGNILNKN
jgi:dihydrofolate synthase/folylpolyglutamate synthase|tara:strand:- start:272 stop:1534 length:1263 start_codon:yes stop_codon:yes gene_type:complete